MFLLSYPSWKIHKAKTIVNHFSQLISVGMSKLQLQIVIGKLDLKIIRSEKSSSEPSKLIAWDGWIYHMDLLHFS